MQYLALLYGREDESSHPDSEAFAEDLQRYEQFDTLAGDAIVGGEALAPSSQAVTLRHGSGAPLVTDGPFTEAAEVVGGFYVLEAPDLDAAIGLAQHIPAATDGAVELRPTVEWSVVDRPLSADERRYLVLLAGKEDPADQPGTPEWDAAVEDHARFAQEAGDAVLAGAALHPAASATTVRVRGGEVLVMDGPFTEANEVVGGLYILAAPSPGAVQQLAAGIPMGPSGLVEVRPIIELDR